MANTGPPVDSGGGPMWIPIAPHRTATGAGGSHDRQTRPESNCGTCTDPSNPNSPRRPMVAAESNYSTEFVPLPVIPCYPKELLNLSEQISSFSETLKQVVAQQESSKAENCQILKQMKIMDQNQADRLNALDAKLDKLLGIQTPETTPFIKFGRGKYPRKKKMFPVIEHASKVAVKAREELPVTRRELPDRAAKHIAPSNEDRSRSRRPRKSRNDLPSYKEVDPDDEQPTSEEPSEKMSHVLNCSELHPEASHTTRSNPETNKQNELPIEEQMEIQTTTPSFETLQLIKNTSVDNGDSRIYTDDGKSEDSLTSADREHQKTETPQINICNLESNGKEIKSTNDTISTSHEQQVTGSNCSDIMDSVEKDFNQSASDSPAQKELACSEPIKQCSEEHRLERNYSPILTTEESVDRSPVEKPVSNVSCLLEEKLVEKVTSYKEPNKTAAVTELIEGSVVKSSDSKGLSTRSRNCSTKDINGFDGNRVTENLTQDSGDSSMPMDVTRDKESTIISKIYEDAIGISQYQQPIPSVLQDSEPAENVVLDLTVDITEPLLGSDSKRLETTVAPVSLNNSNPDKLPEHHEPIDSPTDQPNERAPEVQSLNVSRSPSVLLLETSTDIEKSFLKPCDQLFKDHDQEPASNASGDLETTTEQVNIMEELSTSEGDKILDDSVPMNSILGSLEAENSLALDDEQNSDISGSKPPNTEICTAIQEIISSMLQKLEEDSTQRTDDSQALENNAEGLLTATTDNQQGDISEVGPTANKERVDLEDYELPVYGFERLPHFLLPQDPSQRIRMPKNMTRELKRTDRDQSEFAEHFFPENVLEQEQIPDEVDPTLNNQEMLDEFLEQQNEAFGDHEDFLVVPKSTARVQHLVPPVNSVRRSNRIAIRRVNEVEQVEEEHTASPRRLQRNYALAYTVSFLCALSSRVFLGSPPAFKFSRYSQ